ncbi:uncharacterized protein LOC141913126 [Tubulanus polymorphus]|uniref:uncharacterized protein LOC141913126 n=1 Tax=Tubulanus polymorphus TaxID=672921 RepID=UPI003DA2D723
MSLRTRIRGFTSWVNLRLKSSDQLMNNVIMDIVSGTNMKSLIESLTGRYMKRVQSFDGLTDQQKVTRMEWILEELKSCHVIPVDVYLDCRMFAMRNADTVFELLWRLIQHDIWFLWERAEFLQHVNEEIVCQAPFKWVPEPPPVRKKKKKIEKSFLSGFGASAIHVEDIPDDSDGPDPMIHYEPFPGADLMKSYKIRSHRHGYPRVDRCILEMINAHLQMTKEGRKLEVMSLDDLVDSRVLCAIVNSFIPNLYTTEVLLNDRWSINFILRMTESMWYVQSPFDSEDLVQADTMAMCAYWTSFFMVGYKYRQSSIVVKHSENLKQSIREFGQDLDRFMGEAIPDTDVEALKRKNDLLHRKQETEQKLSELEKKFDVKFCYKWVYHVKNMCKMTRKIIKDKMKARFEVISAPRNITINDLCLSLVINLSLTGGSGFHKASGRETCSESRRIILRCKDTGQFYDDFTTKDNNKLTVRQRLHLNASKTVDINPDDYPQYDMYFESQSRNKQLKTGSSFMYLLFPGNTNNWQKLYLKAARDGELEIVEKLVTFFRDRPSFINCKEQPQANSALHLAARAGHMNIVLFLLENGANIDARNSFRCTPLFGAIEGLHRDICHLLIEWGCDINVKNIGRHTAFETVKNDEFKLFLTALYNHYSSVVPKIMAGDTELLAKVVRQHKLNIKPLCKLQSRCINGSTLLHTAAYFGDIETIKQLLKLRIDVNLSDYKGASPLHRAKDIDTMQILLEYGADVEREDIEGNTALHVKCYGESDKPSATDLIHLLLNVGASFTVRNSRGLMPIHCAAMQGRTDVIQLLQEFDINKEILKSLNEENARNPPSLVMLAVSNDFIDCAEWLINSNVNFKENEQDVLLQRIITKQVKVKKSTDVVHFLLENGADPNPRYSNGNSAIHFAAAMTDKPDILEVLLEFGADPDMINNEQNTPLFFATRSSNHFAAKILISHGADLRHRNYQGLNAFDCIPDFEEWIESGVFTTEIRARLKAFQLKHSRDLVRAISAKVQRPHQRQFAPMQTRSSDSLQRIVPFGLNRSSSSLSTLSTRTLSRSFHPLGALPPVKHPALTY